MKRLDLLFLLLFPIFLAAQQPCDFSTDVKDSLGTYRSTRETIFFERNFGGTSSYIFFSLVKTDGLPTLNVEFINKSNDFIKANCLDKNSRMFLQLANGKVVTLIHMDKESCGTMIRDMKGKNNRVQQGIFLFVKGAMEDLKESPVVIMRIRYSTDTLDYIVKSELVSELDAKVYHPERYFMDTLHCLYD